MNIYLDLSFIPLMMIGICESYLVEVLLIEKIKWKKRILLGIFYSLQFLFIELPLFLPLLISLGINIFCVYFFYKSDKIKIFFLNYLTYFLIVICLILLSKKSLRLYKGILIVSSPEGILYSLFIPFFGIMLYLSSLFVDNVYRLNNYKMIGIVQKDNKKVLYKCYFDTGNTLKHKGIPVIFCLKDKWLFESFNEEEILVTTIGGETKVKCEKALIELEDSSTSYFVYVVLVNDVSSFHGCEILLNAYLG